MPPGPALLLVVYLAFVSLGLPDGVLGVAWPSVRRSFDLPLHSLGSLLAASMAGYLGSSLGSGALVARMGVGRLLLWSSAIMVASALGTALAPAWPVMLACGVAAGLGAGAVDAGLNGFAAAHCSARRITWLHASYGIGAMLGPLLMSAALGGAGSWRLGYGVLGAILLLLTLAFAATLPRWPARTRAVAASERGAGTLGWALTTPGVWAHAGLFFLYTGLEVTAGQWTYSLFTEARGMAPGVAAVWIALYWGGLTGGRVLTGVLTSRYRAEVLLRVGMLAAPAAALALWSDAGGWLGPVGLAGLGLAFAPVYPLLVSLTPGRLGPTVAVHAIGIQVAAAYVGTAAIPWLVGVLAHERSLEIVGPVLVGATVILLALHELSGRGSARPPGWDPA